MKRLLILLVLAAVACAPKKNQSPAVRDFPMAEVPTMFTEPEQRLAWLSEHFWDRYCDTSRLYLCDSLTINGVKAEEVEKQVGLFATMLQQEPLEAGQKAMARCFARLEAFQKAHPEGNVYKEVSALVARYFYDPNSPVRSEDLYLPFVSSLAVSPLTEETLRPGFVWDARNCALNRTGTTAADFVFVDTAGKKRSLHGIKARWLLLIFGNPDCNACQELLTQMEASPAVSELIRKGTLKVADIYIDEDLSLWKERMASYPKTWINGYDPTFTIRTDRLYAVRALPSLYLLDEEKKVLLKDALPEQVLGLLESL